jgi:DNA adenine methylase
MTQIYLLPELEPEERTKLVNVASVPQRSPFRYPGGKTWLVPLIRRWLTSFHQRPELFVEPFAGGGIISLTAAFEKLADRVLMVELDEQVAAVWETILTGNAEWLASHILKFNLTPESARAEVAKKPRDVRDLAFQTLLKNRTAHGGILAEGAGVLKHGENGKGILSRWYPQTIARRIRTIPSVSSRLQFQRGDAFEVLSRYRNNARAVFFIDPPYTAGGKRAGSRLYKHCEIDHERLFSVCEQIRGDFLMTYDNAEEVRVLAKRHDFAVKTVPMKNTHHAEMTELLIGRNFAWLERLAAPGTAALGGGVGGCGRQRASDEHFDQPPDVESAKRRGVVSTPLAD